MSAALPLLSPLVTRILELSGFPPELKTRDIQSVFAQWEDDRGGFKIKWVDDTTALIIFADPGCAKRAYLSTLMYPPPLLMTSAGVMAKVRPYDGDDASSIISSVQNRTRSRSSIAGQGPHTQATPAYGLAATGSSSGGSDNNDNGGASSPNTSPQGPPVARSALQAQAASQQNINGNLIAPGHGHRRNPSGSNPGSLPAKPLAAALYDAANGGPSPAYHLANALAMESRSSSSTGSTGNSGGVVNERHSPLPARPPPQLHAAVNSTS